MYIERCGNMLNFIQQYLHIKSRNYRSQIQSDIFVY